MTAHGSFETFCPSRSVSRDHASWECHRGGSAKLGEQLLVPIGEDDVSAGAVRKRAVVQRFSWGHWLRVLRKVLAGCRTTGRCVLVPGLSPVLKGVPNFKLSESSIESAGVAPATALRPDCPAVHTSLSIKPTHLSHTVFKQHLTTVLLPLVLHETCAGRRHATVSSWAALRTAKVFPWAPWAVVSASAVS